MFYALARQACRLNFPYAFSHASAPIVHKESPRLDGIRRNLMTKKTYFEKLKDPRWQKLRLEVMQANEFCCEICGSGEETLNVHHKEYFKGVEPWDYVAKQLACLCETCHKNEHDAVDVLKWASSFLNLDGNNNRVELGFVVSGYIGAPYEALLEFASLPDCIAYKAAHAAGVSAKKTFNESIEKGSTYGTR